MTIIGRSRWLGCVSLAALVASFAGCISGGGPAPVDDTQPGRRHGFCAPPVPVVAEAFPTPADTTPAAAAMARAQADFDAAVKNAAQNASYAACMASGSAR